MVTFTVDQIHDAMKRQHNIRNISIVAHVDSGKTTVTDSLLNKAGIISNDNTGEKRGMDTRPDEQERIITIKSTGISLYYEIAADQSKKLPSNSQGNGFLINLIDSPGHVDFSSEVTAALRVTDGCIVIIDAVKGVCVQTETVLQQALSEMIQPVCMINKLDRLIMELKLTPEEIYRKIESHLRSLNNVILRYNKKMPPINLCPSKGTVAIGCGKMGWGFTLGTFAKRWSSKLNIPPDELITYLWGDHFYSPKEKKWFTQKKKGTVRGFNQFVIKPIIEIIHTVENQDDTKIQKIIDSLGVTLSDKDRFKSGKGLLKTIMQQFLPNSESLLEMIVMHLPSPVTAQQYRVDELYTGPKDDEYYNAIKNCDPDGPLVMYISKLFPTPDLSRFFAFGRVFSGRVKTTNVRIQGPEYSIGEKTGVFNGRIQNVAVWMASEAKTLPNCPAGNTCAIGGIDKYIVKTSTLTDNPNCHNIKDMKFAVSPVVSVAVECSSSADLPKLLQGLTLLTKSDPLCQTKFDKDTGEIIISGAGELHLEICINDLRGMFAKGVDIKVSDPVVPFRETVTSLSSQICLAKSPNKHNRIYLTAEPLATNLVEALVNKEITSRMDPKLRTRTLVTEYDWSQDTARKIWCFSEQDNTNLFVDITKGVQYLNEIKDNVNASFQHSVYNGPLCNEPIRGVRFNLNDCVLHADAIHRGGGQIIPTARRAMYASMLTASPRLMEPIYLVDIQCPSDISGSIYSVMARKRGQVISEDHDPDTQICNLKAHLPVAESIGFTSFIRSETGGKAFPQCSFSHWDIINDDPLTPGTKSYEIVREVRKRKGMPEDLPPLSRYLDRL